MSHTATSGDRRHKFNNDWTLRVTVGRDGHSHAGFSDIRSAKNFFSQMYGSDLLSVVEAIITDGKTMLVYDADTKGWPEG